MARYDVVKMTAPPYEYAVDVQADNLSFLKTTVIIPLAAVNKVKKEPVPRLTPIIMIFGKPYMLVTHNIAAIERKQLGQVVTNIEEHHYTIVDAVDFLLQGF